MGQSVEACKFFEFKKNTWIPVYHARPPFDAESLINRLVQPHATYRGILQEICGYQRERQKRFFRSGKSGDPTQLFLEELKDWVQQFSVEPLNTQATLDKLNLRRQYVAAVIFSGEFYPGKNFNWTSKTFEQTVLSVLSYLDDHVNVVTNGIAELSVEERLNDFGTRIDNCINLLLPYVLFTLSDTAHLTRGAGEVRKALADVQAQYKTGVGLLYRELICCEELRRPNDRDRALTEEFYLAKGQRRPINFFVDNRGATIIAPGVLHEMAQRVDSLDPSPRYFFDQLEQNTKGLSGVLPLFLGQVQLLETYVGLFGKIQHLAACRALFVTAVSMTQAGGEMVLVGNAAVNENLRLLMRVAAALLNEILSMTSDINVAVDDALCDIVAAPEEEKGRRRAAVKAISSSRRDAFKANYKQILEMRKKLDTALRGCQSCMSPIIEVLEQSVTSVRDKAKEAVSQFVSNVEALLGKTTATPDKVAKAVEATLSLNENSVLAAAAATAAAAAPPPSGKNAKPAKKDKDKDKDKGKAPAAAASAASAAAAKAALPVSNNDIAELADVEQLVRHIEMRRIRLDDALAQSWCDGQIAPHRGSIRSIDVSKSTITVGAARALCRIFAACPALREIRFWHAELDDESAAAIAELLVVTSTVPRHACSLRTLDLNENRIGPAGAESLARGLRVNMHLTWLDLGFNRLGDGGVALICRALAHNRALKGLILVRNLFGDAGAAAIAQLLIDNRSLVRIGLQQNSIGDDGALAIVDALRGNDTLQQLSLSENEMTDVGGRALLKLALDTDRLLLSASQCHRFSADLSSGLAARERIVRSTIYVVE